MSIRKTANGRWQATERLGGRGSRRVSRTFDRKGDAQVWVDQMRRQRHLGQAPVEDVTLAEFMETYWELHAVPNLAASTRASYKAIWVKHIHPRLGGRNLRELTPKIVTRFRADLEKAGVGVATVRKALALLQSILTFAVVEERVDFNAASAVRKPRYQRAREPVIFLPGDVEAIRNRLSQSGPERSQRDATLISVLAYAGPRPEEALRLTWADVGTEALHFVDTKRHQERWTPLLAPLVADLREWQLASGRPGPKAPVFPAHDGGHWQLDDYRNWRKRTWRAVAPEATRPRDLRSSFITLRVYEGIPLTTIARECGTSTAMIDRHYAGILNNWDGRRVPAEDQIRAARDAPVPVRREG